jgi:hypothetical protein
LDREGTGMDRARAGTLQGRARDRAGSFTTSTPAMVFAPPMPSTARCWPSGGGAREETGGGGGYTRSRSVAGRRQQQQRRRLLHVRRARMFGGTTSRVPVGMVGWGTTTASHTHPRRPPWRRITPPPHAFSCPAHHATKTTPKRVRCQPGAKLVRYRRSRGEGPRAHQWCPAYALSRFCVFDLSRSLQVVARLRRCGRAAAARRMQQLPTSRDAVACHLEFAMTDAG